MVRKKVKRIIQNWMKTLLRCPPLGLARMTKGGRCGPFQNDRSAGHFPRLVYAERYLNTIILQRNFSNFWPGSTNTRHRANETTARAGPPKPTRNAKDHKQPTTRRNETTAHAAKDQPRTQKTPNAKERNRHMHPKQMGQRNHRKRLTARSLHGTLVSIDRGPPPARGYN